MDAVIMAGGRGERIASVEPSLPKPMIPVCGKPVLEMLVESLAGQGFGKIKIVTGYKAEVIEDHFGDGKDFGCDISYFRESEPLGTAGALYYMADELSDDFFLINGDIVADIDFERMARFHNEKGGDACVLVHPNNHPFDSSKLLFGEDGRITKWYKKCETSQSCKNRSNAGVHILRKRVIGELLDGGRKDLDADILIPLSEQGRVYAYETSEYVKDMGTPERYEAVIRDISSGKPAGRRLGNKQRAVFLDRDGTLNVYKGFITSPGQIELEKGVAEAVRLINSTDMLAIVVTNQPVIARGDCTFEDMEKINGRLEDLLGKEGAYIDDLFYCPHHPDKGFEGEVAELKIKCSCRKPEPGLLLKAAQKYNIDLKSSYMVGDALADVKAGHAAGCRCVYIGSKRLENGKDDIREMPEGTAFYDSLLAFVKAELGEKADMKGNDQW